MSRLRVNRIEEFTSDEGVGITDARFRDGPWFDPMHPDYGAVGDGATNDVVALNACIAAAAAVNGNVRIKPGTYAVAGHVLFEGFENTTISLPGVKFFALASFTQSAISGNDGVVVLKDCDNVVFEYAEVDGNEPNLGALTATHGIYVANATSGGSVRVQHCKVRNAVWDSIYAYQCDRFEAFRNDVAAQGRHGIVTEQADDVEIVRNKIVGTGDQGAVAVTQGNGGIGVLASRGAKARIIRNDISQMSDTGSKTEGIDDVVMAWNIVDTFGKDGLKVQPYPGSTTVVENAVIEYNTIKTLQHWRADGAGYILIQSTRNGRATGNKIVGTAGSAGGTEDGIRVNNLGSGSSVDSDRITVNHNHIVNATDGINMTATKGKVTENEITSSTASSRGVLVWGSNMLVMGNSIDTLGIGVLLNTDIVRTRILGNAFANNTTGVYAANSGDDYTTIIGNEFASTVTTPINRIDYNNDVCHSNPGHNGSEDQLWVGGKRHIAGTAAPASGTWTVGERVYRTNPSAGGKSGWICTTAGTPGTWKEFGVIDA